uniref:Transporter n=1 Tax=Rhipicephalus zambeziensis TaxID=60191 RepID=A0A224Z282_9ACAR
MQQLQQQQQQPSVVDGVRVQNMEEDLESVARRELGETPDVKQKSLAELRELLEGEKGLVVPPDDVLVMFLRAKKYRVEDAFKTIRKYLRARRDVPEYFDNLTPSNIPYETFFYDHKLIMFARNSQGQAVGYLQFGAWNRSICSIDDLMRCALVATESNLREEETQIRGLIGVIDLKGFGAHHMTLITLRFARRVISIGQDSLPIRLKGVYYLHTPAVFRIVHALVKPFLSEKMLKRLRFLAGGISELRDVVPPELIPKEFGGTQEDFDFHKQEKFFHSKAGYFEKMLKCGYQRT